MLKFFKWTAIIFFVLVVVATILVIGMTPQNLSKEDATKSIHDTVAKKIIAKLVDCELGESSILSNLSCSGITGIKVINYIGENGSVFVDKNPYNFSNWAVRASVNNKKDEDVGFINLSYSSSELIIKSCFKTPCKEATNQLEQKIMLK